MFGMPDVFDIVTETTNALKQRRNIETAMRMWITTSDPASKQFLESNGIVVPPSVQQLQQQQQQQQQQPPPLLQQPGVIVTPTHKKTPPRIAAPPASSASQYVQKQEKHVYVNNFKQPSVVATSPTTTLEDKFLYSLSDPTILATSAAGAILGYVSSSGSMGNRLAMSALGAFVPVATHALVAV
jgi:hypothetical protein